MTYFSLRVVAERLHARVGDPKLAVPYLGLLEHLCSGKLKASLRLPIGDGLQIAIPASYWIQLKPGEFRTILISKRRKNRQGTVEFPLRKSLMLYSSIDESSVEGVKQLVMTPATGFPVVVANEDLDAFLSPLEERIVTRNKGGRNENEKWVVVLVEAAAILLRDQADETPRSHDAVAKAALEAAEKRSIPKANLPSERSVTDRISEIKRLAKL